MSNDYEYETELTAGREEVAAVLGSVLDGLTAGSIRLNDGAKTVTATVPDELDLEVEFEVVEGEVSLELELAWPAPDGDSSAYSLSDGQSGDASVDHSDDSSADHSSDIPADTSADNPADTSDNREESPAPVESPIDVQSLARFEIFRDKGDEWRWRLRHRNGNVIATSGEGYTRKHNAQKGLRSVIRNAPHAELTEDATD